MLIVSKIERQGGTSVTIGESTYHFTPGKPGGKHVCEVEEPRHIRRLLSITEGFEAFSPEEAAEFMDAADVLEERIEPEGNEPTEAPTQTPEDALEQNVEPEGNDEEGEDSDQDAEQALEDAIEPSDDGLEDLDDLSLAHAYEDAIGSKPKGNMKRDTMIKRIRAAGKEG